MNKIIALSSILLSFAWSKLGSATDNSDKESRARLTVYNVGVGQCYDLELYDADKKKTQHMLIGFGIEEEALPDRSEEDRSKGRLKPSDYQRPSSTLPFSVQELRKELRNKYKKPSGEGIEVEAIFLTQPFKDRGLLMSLFNHEADHIHQIWLAGLPENYYEDKREAFKSWLEQQRAKQTKISFLGVEGVKGGSLFLQENRRYKHPYFTSSSKEGEDRLNFGPFKISFLAINPTHFPGHGHKNFGIENIQEVVIRSSFPEDLNSDSLLIKVRHGSSSVLLTGNATSLTTNRALNNYINKPKSVQANVLVASSYGSTAQGSNDTQWVRHVNPQCVVISHGASRLTFDQKAYKIFTQSNLVSPVVLHEVPVQVPEVQSYSTNKSIFSTLSSGTIRVDLYKKRFTLETEKEGRITLLKATEQLEQEKESFSSPQIEKEEVIEKPKLTQYHQPKTLQRTRSTTSSPKIDRHKATRTLSTSHPKSAPNSPFKGKKSSSKIKKVERPKSLASVKEKTSFGRTKNSRKSLKKEEKQEKKQAVIAEKKYLQASEESSEYDSNPITQVSTSTSYDSSRDESLEESSF